MMRADKSDLLALEAAKRYVGEFAWRTLAMSVVLTGSYIAVPYALSHGMLPVWLAFAAMAAIVYASYTVMHEAVHGSIAGQHKSLRWLNELAGYLAALVLLIPMTAHRHEHLAHHRHTNDEAGDPDRIVASMTRSPVAAIHAAAGRVMLQQYRYYFTHRWNAGRKRQNLAFCAEVAAAIALRAVLIFTTDPLVTACLLVAAGLCGVMITMYLFAYIVHEPHTAVGRYVDTSTILVRGAKGKLVTWLWLFQNYHAIHHLFPRVPFYRYAELFDEIRPIMVDRQAPIYELGLNGLRPLGRDGLSLSAA